MPRMGELAESDSYEPFAAETFVPPPLQDWTAQAAPKDVGVLRGVMGSLADVGSLPQRAIQNSQDALYTGTYNPRVPVEAALTAMGGGVGGTGAKAGETALAAGYDPKLWHGVSSIKLPKPIDEMSAILRPTNPAPETVISPARLQNSMLMPLLGDRTAAAAQLERVNGFPFENPVALQGGHGYMANTPEMAWAAGKSIAPGIARVAREGAETGLPVHGVYTAMGERSADFSNMMSDTLSEMAKHTKITPEGEAIFNDTMRKIAPDFPGVLSPNAAGYLRAAPGELRNVFAKTMDTGKMQKYGFPSVAEARVAVTDPRLLHEPTGASGLSIARMDPQGTLGPSGHATYDTGIAGDYVGGLPASVPKEIMWPDIVGPLSTHADAVAAARVAAGKTPFRPTEDYLMGRTPVGLPKLQEANQQWVDSVSKHLEDRGFTLGSGATDQKGAAAIQGIRAASENNPGIHKGKPFWSGAFDPLDGHIIETHPYQKAVDADFHHSHYFSDKAVNAMSEGRAQFFWLDKDGNVQTAWREAGAKPDIVEAIKGQLGPKGTTLGAGATDQKGAAAIQGIRAFHSSPHDFERFDLSKIGTGEGAQAYGHGLYFSENPAVSGQGGQYWNQFSRRFEGPEKEAASYLKAQQFDRQKAIEALRAELADEAGKSYPDFARRQETLRLLESGAPVGPRTYEVNINADPAHMLDWDKPLSQQSPHVQERLQTYGIRPGLENAFENRYGVIGEPTGAKIYESSKLVPGGYRQSAAASNALANVDIPGIKYLDAGSRQHAQNIADAEKAAQQMSYLPRDAPVRDEWLQEVERLKQTPVSSNYVVFDPSIIDIMRKYGIAGAAPAGMGALAAQDYYQTEERN